MKKQILSLAILASIAVSAQIYTPTGSITGTTINPSSGNIAIGHNNPLRKLHIANGDMYIDGAAVINFGDDARFTVSNTTIPTLSTPNYSMGQYGIAAPSTLSSAELWVSGNDGVRFFTRALPRMTILNNGNIGIGSLNPDSQLTVKGLIHAEEVKVDLNVPADYVFQKYYTGISTLKPEYKMPTLEYIEEFTKKNNHLPNIPSAKEIKENGMNTGEMINLLLQKIEELTLYTIEQNKRIKELESKITKK
ncbi:hypothetical protein PFY12_10650 [Chryseobacterium camelliae]|uniref:BZIP transcription factor n=1 Tax=Chryseobacterium camelliae TaxID=1265445 RepID=A0ABY7QIR5_9FLAO|nr:hypothetical protein [Chryseobacterium camelliae]WBV59515.1 hypothetical protein PFY12_10650 [Chryseobacterium camelliae]